MNRIKIKPINEAAELLQQLKFLSAKVKLTMYQTDELSDIKITGSLAAELQSSNKLT